MPVVRLAVLELHQHGVVLGGAEERQGEHRGGEAHDRLGQVTQV